MTGTYWNLNFFLLSFAHSCVWRPAVQAEWDHIHAWLAQGVPDQQELRVAGGGTRTIPYLHAV